MRITPARAGKTGDWFFVPRQYRDHPRSCGKDLLMLDPSVLDLGSPPLVRERPMENIADDPSGRITPARAGKTN